MGPGNETDPYTLLMCSVWGICICTLGLPCMHAKGRFVRLSSLSTGNLRFSSTRM